MWDYIIIIDYYNVRLRGTLLQFSKHSSSPCWDLAPSAPSHQVSATQASWLSSEVTSLRKLLWSSKLIISCIFSALVQYIAMVFLRVCLSQKAMSFLRWAPCHFSSAQHGSRASVNAQRLKPKSWASNVYKLCLKHIWDYWLVRKWISWLFLKKDIRKWSLETNLSELCKSLRRYIYSLHKVVNGSIWIVIVQQLNICS